MCINIFKSLILPSGSIKSCYNSFSKVLKTNDYNEIALKRNLKYKYCFLKQISQCHTNQNTKKLDENNTPLQMKSRLIRKKRAHTNIQDASIPGFWQLKALATAEQYNLEGLMEALQAQNLYIPVEIESSSFVSAIHAKAKYEVDTESREIFFFRQGTVVMWNVAELECTSLLRFLKQYEENRYNEDRIIAEQERTFYSYTERHSYLENGNIFLSTNENLDRYTFSNALSQTVKLGIWESFLESYIDSIQFITQDLKKGNKILMTRQAVLQKQGEIFALRHSINLSSDLLDTPDFYWERDDLEILYRRTCDYFSISKRTKVVNTKINHCVELVELLSSHLSDKHHIRLEWMVIVLIMVEVAFEAIHYLDRYFA